METKSKTLATIKALGKWGTPREFADYASQDKPENNTKGNSISKDQSGLNEGDKPGKKLC
jgi:hypothetical protein